MQGENSFDEPNLSNDHALQGMRWLVTQKRAFLTINHD
jgi:hypothetical protein